MKEEDLIYASGMLSSRLLNLFKDPSKLDFKSILIVKLDEIGDMVNTLHVFTLLKGKFPNAKITLWCKPFVKSLVENDPHIDCIIHSSKELDSHYDLIADLRGSWDSLRYSITHPPLYKVDRGTVRLRNKLKGGQPHEVITNLEIIEPVLGYLPQKQELRLFINEQQKQKAEEFVKQNSISDFAVFHCGARRELRKWKMSNFISLAGYLKSEKGLDIIFAGDQSDIPEIKIMQEKIHFKTFSIASEFSLTEYAALCSLAKIFIGNESGPLHIAAASQIPVVGLYGPGVPVTFYPWGDQARYVHHVLDCNPCDQIHCVRPEFTCMDMITIEEVKEKVNELI